MQEGRASKTAEMSAVMRAAHRLLDPAPWILVDEMAMALSGLKDEAALRAELSALEVELARFAEPATAAAWIRSARLSVALRARFAEDVLAQAMQRGVRQYVILGAGFDSFAYCRCDWTSGLSVYEVDHRDTQRVKLERLHRLGIELPAALSFVPIDFQRENIFEALATASFRRDQPAVFCWLGVTLYLSVATIKRTLREIGDAAPGSVLVLDYLKPERLLDDEMRRVLQVTGKMASSYGEPGGTCFDPESIAALLQECGLSDVQDLGADAANARYFPERGDGVRIPELLHVVSARAGPA